MASRFIHHNRYLPLFAFGTAFLTTSSLLYRYSRLSACAEEPSPSSSRDSPSNSASQSIFKKPIYRDQTYYTDGSSNLRASTDLEKYDAKSNFNRASEQHLLTVTQRLASHIRPIRLALHSFAEATEDCFYQTLDSVFCAEEKFINTVRSLAPPPSSNEKVLPGILTATVVVLASTIFARRRNILVRGSLASLLGAFTLVYTLPITSGNVESLLLKWEAEYTPQLKERHEYIHQRVERFLETGRQHSDASMEMLKDRIREHREKAVNWLSRIQR